MTPNSNRIILVSLLVSFFSRSAWPNQQALEKDPFSNYLTFQALASIAYARPVISINYERKLSKSFGTSISLTYENWPRNVLPDSIQEEIHGIGAKYGFRYYLPVKSIWYAEMDFGVFHFLNGIKSGPFTYFGFGPFIGNKRKIWRILVDANFGWMFGPKEPDLIQGIYDGSLLNVAAPFQMYEHPRIYFYRLLYPYMRIETNLAFGFQF